MRVRGGWYNPIRQTQWDHMAPVVTIPGQLRDEDPVTIDVDQIGSALPADDVTVTRSWTVAA